YSRELDSREIPHILVAGRSFHQREEVENLRAALAAIEWPDDELSVFATLRGPLFALPDELLLGYKDLYGRLHPFRRLEGEVDARVAAVREALDVLQLLHRQRNARPVAETVGELLATTRAQAGFAMCAAGDQILANLQRVIELARGFEMTGGLS